MATMLKDLLLENVIYQRYNQKLKHHQQWKKAFMTNQLIPIFYDSKKLEN